MGWAKGKGRAEIWGLKDAHRCASSRPGLPRTKELRVRGVSELRFLLRTRLRHTLLRRDRQFYLLASRAQAATGSKGRRRPGKGI